MGTLIFVIYDWNAIEPITYLVCKYPFFNLKSTLATFYAVIGAAFYLWFKSDWGYTSAFDMFKTRKLRRLYRRRAIDEQKA